MPIIAIIALAGAAVSAFTVVQGIRNDNKDAVKKGMLGLFTAAIGGASLLSSASAAANAATGAAQGTQSAAGSLAQLGEASKVGSNLSTITQGASGIGQAATEGVGVLQQMGNVAPGLVEGASSTAQATQALAGGAGTMGNELLKATDAAGGLKESVSGLTKMGDYLKKGLEFAQKNPEVIKMAGSVGQGILQNQSDKAYLEEVRKENERRQREADITNANRNSTSSVMGVYGGMVE